MFYIIETQKQVEEISLLNWDQAIINIIPYHNLIHPKLNKISLIYIQPVWHHKGYVLPISHSETKSLELDLISSTILNKINKMFLLNKKFHLYFLPQYSDKMYDVNFISPVPEYFDNCESFFYQNFKDTKFPNYLIPLSKTVEKQDFLFSHILSIFKSERFNEFISTEFNVKNNILTNVFFEIEKKGLNTQNLETYFNLNNPQYSLSGNIHYTNYNLYNNTLRPSCNFNGVNMLNISKKDTDKRKCFIPKNDTFLNIDFKSYHLHILKNILNYNIEGDIHTFLGKKYFKKEILTEDEYNKSKQKTFQIIYSESISTTGIEFIDLINEFKQTLSIPISHHIQNLETELNIYKIREILKYLGNLNSYIYLYNYDSILIDWDKKESMNEVLRIMGENNYPISIKEQICF